MLKRRRGFVPPRPNNYVPPRNPNIYANNNIMPNNTAVVAAKVKTIDPNFSEEKFLSWAKDVFVKLQMAWTQRDWSVIRTFETPELFEQHSQQLQEYIDLNKINVMERIAVNYSELYEFKQDGDKEMLSISLKSTMKDYIIDATTKQVLEGDRNIDRHGRYRMTFVRKAGVKTVIGTDEKKTTNCPNCGAPTEITSAGKCNYCGSVITIGEHDWVLSNIEPIR
jgi:Uncharacterized protein conserved in bacteria